jgi:hypothetical protein
MRTIRSSRDYGDPRAADVQSMIAERPLTVEVYRPAPSQRNTTLSRPLVSTFQARIDPYRQSYADAKHERVGQEIDIIFLMTTCYPTDKDGNTIDFTQGDEVEVGGKVYVVTSKVPYASYKCEGVLRLKQ